MVVEYLNLLIIEDLSEVVKQTRGLTGIADAADALRGEWGSQVKIADVILEQIF